MRSSRPRTTSRSRWLRLARSGVRDPLNMHDWVPFPVVSQVPRRFCDPQEAFGTPSAPARLWRPPTGSTDPKDWSEFREAVLQHAICIAVRRHKNQHGVTQERLARLDDRSNAGPRWNALLNGRRLMTLEVVAFLPLHFPDALPARDAVTTLLAVAEKDKPAPYGWDEVDR